MNALPLLIELSARLWSKYMTTNDEKVYDLYRLTEDNITKILEGPQAVKRSA